MDNVIIVQELIHFMAKKKGRDGVMAIKLNLDKPYDCLEWSFIRDTLNLYKFPSQLVSLVMSCVSTSSISILVNKGALESFYPSRGIRQGDPISSYLFILCMEVLGALIKDKCKAKLWNSVKASQSGLAFSHVFFFGMISCFLRKQIGIIALLLGMLLIPFVSFLGKILAVKILGSIFLQMLIQIRDLSCVKYWDSAPLPLVGNTWVFPLSI